MDALLLAYHRPGSTDIQKQKLLVLILYYCTTWLVRKRNKTKSWRRKHVQYLLGEVEAELRTETMKQATLDRLSAGGKDEGGTVRGPLSMQVSPIEMLQPKDANEKWNLRGGLVNPRRLTAHDAQVKIGNAGDYVDGLKVLAESNARASNQVQKTLVYLNEGARCGLLLVPGDDGKFRRGEDSSPYSTGALSESQIYVMDVFERIFISKSPSGKFHHSSFLSGKSVICGGNMLMVQGEIRYLDNSSGHYKPDTADLLACVQLLERCYELDLEKIKIENICVKPGWRTTAAEFVRCGGVRPGNQVRVVVEEI